MAPCTLIRLSLNSDANICNGYYRYDQWINLNNPPEHYHVEYGEYYEERHIKYCRYRKSLFYEFY